MNTFSDNLAKKKWKKSFSRIFRWIVPFFSGIKQQCGLRPRKQNREKEQDEFNGRERRSALKRVVSIKRYRF